MKTTTFFHSRYFLIIFSVIVLLGFQQCSSDGKDITLPDDSNTPDCDVSNVTFSGTVWPIISSNCTSCHSGTSPNGGVRLESFATIKVQASIPAGSYGSLYGAISHNSGNNPMPRNANKLSDCDIQLIKAWIDAGMPNN
jgi:hypothetical protein